VHRWRGIFSRCSRYNLNRMIRPPSLIVISFAAIAALFSASKFPATTTAHAQELDFELDATARVLPEVGPGVRALRRDKAGRYYALSSPGTSVMAYHANGRLLGKVPPDPTKETAIVNGVDFDVDATGQIYVADTGSNLIRVYSNIEDEGRDIAEFPVSAPVSVAALPDGEIAVTSIHVHRLIQIYDLHGKMLREFGYLEDLADHRDLNRYLNSGRLITDPSNHLYLAFLHLPEPTVRRYDRTGTSTLQIELNTLEFAPEATAKRRVIQEQDEKGKPIDLKPVINAVGVDPVDGDIWIAVDDELVHYDSTGDRKGTTYRTFTADGTRVAPVSILVEPTRLLLAADPIGVYAFARPDKMNGNPETKPAEKSESKPGDKTAGAATKPAAPSQKP
jgi:hypothetical protein